MAIFNTNISLCVSLCVYVIYIFFKITFVYQIDFLKKKVKMHIEIHSQSEATILGDFQIFFYTYVYITYIFRKPKSCYFYLFTFYLIFKAKYFLCLWIL